MATDYSLRKYGSLEKDETYLIKLHVNDPTIWMCTINAESEKCVHVSLMYNSEIQHRWVKKTDTFGEFVDVLDDATKTDWMRVYDQRQDVENDNYFEDDDDNLTL
jgi:hypothetical protein